MNAMKWNFALPASLCVLAAGCGGNNAGPAGSAGPGLKSLPLQHGYFVASDTACSDASNATLMLVSTDGINSSRTFCDYASVEQASPTQFRATLSCTDFNFTQKTRSGFPDPQEQEAPAVSRRGLLVDQWSGKPAAYMPMSPMPPGGPC